MYLARPKSRILSSQSSLTAMFDGFRSRWMMPAEWTYLLSLDVYSPNKRTLSILHAADDLVDEELDVVVGKLLSLDDVVEVSAHEVSDHIHVTKLVQAALWREAVQQTNDLKTPE